MHTNAAGGPRRQRIGLCHRAAQDGGAWHWVCPRRSPQCCRSDRRHPSVLTQDARRVAAVLRDYAVATSFVKFRKQLSWLRRPSRPETLIFAPRPKIRSHQKPQAPRSRLTPAPRTPEFGLDRCGVRAELAEGNAL